MTDTMTSRERWLAVLARKKPDRVPMDYWATPEATDRLIDLIREHGRWVEPGSDRHPESRP